jgi:uncharacterized protein YwgA
MSLSVRSIRDRCGRAFRFATSSRASIVRVTRRDWLLVLCAYRGAPAGLDPVRIQKGMFLFARNGGIPAREQYDFKPYDYGPMSPEIYRDLDSLVAQGWLEQHPVPGKRWSRYAATDRGRDAAEARLRRLKTDQEKMKAKRLYDIKQDVATVSFNQLLDRVYREHPDMAVHSVFRSLH